MTPLAQGLAKATVLLCQPAGRRAPKSVGSAVLIGVDGNRYLFTASHVFDHASRSVPIFAAASRRFAVLGPTIWRTKPSHSRVDRTDLAIVPLGPDADDDWADNRCLSLDELDPIPRALDSAPATGFLAIGFPHSKQPRIFLDRAYTPYAHHFVTNYEPLTAGNRIDADPEKHIAIGFDASEFVSPFGDSTLPKPTGMSGGGLWRIPNALAATDPQATLVGILIEHHPAPERVILATRLGNPLQALARLDEKVYATIRSRFPSLFPG
jgi:hypothetical protein